MIDLIKNCYVILLSLIISFGVSGCGEASLNNIYIAEMPNKTVYNVGETLDTTGLKVIANYSNKNTNIIDDFTLSNTYFDTIGTHIIEVGYYEKSTSFEIMVEKGIQLAPSIIDLTTTESSVLITPILNAEYKFGEDGSYTENNYFEGLTPNSNLKIYARIKESENYKSSNAICKEIVIPKGIQNSPSDFKVQTTNNSITIEEIDGVEYKLNSDGVWSNEREFKNLDDNATYEVYVRLKANDEYQASNAVYKTITL